MELFDNCSCLLTPVQRAQLLREFEILRAFLNQGMHLDCSLLQTSANRLPAVIDGADELVQEQSDIEMTTCDVHHVDAAAEIPPEEAEVISKELWASSIEQLASKPLKSGHLRLICIEFSRHSATLHQAILDAPLVKRFAQEGGSIQPEWANGAFVLAPVEAADIDKELHSRIVLVDGEEDMLSLLDALEHLQYKDRKLKPNGLSLVVDPCPCLHRVPRCGSEAQHSAEFSEACEPMYYDITEVPVRNTFVDFHVPHSAAACASRSV